MKRPEDPIVPPPQPQAEIPQPSIVMELRNPLLQVQELPGGGKLLIFITQAGVMVSVPLPMEAARGLGQALIMTAVNASLPKKPLNFSS